MIKSSQTCNTCVNAALSKKHGTTGERSLVARPLLEPDIPPYSPQSTRLKTETKMFGAREDGKPT